MKKKLTVLMLAACVAVSGCGSGVEKESKSENISVTDSEKEPETIDGFEKAEYEKYNSYADENGLGGTPIYIKGKVLNQTKIADSKPPLISIVVEQKDGNRWCVAVPSESKIKGIEGKSVRAFGTYQGFSDVANLPALAVASDDEEYLKKARIDVKKSGKYKTAWSFSDYAKEELEKEEKKEEKKEKEEKGNKSDKTESLFPNEDKYIVNNSLIRYNESAKYPIDENFISDLKEISRPLGKANLTVSNGVYFIIRYNDFNESVFVDYQAEASDDSGLFFVVRDMTKAVNPEIKDEDFKEMWESFKSGKYLNHYDNSFGLKDFDFSFAIRVVNEGKTQYSIKSRYYIHGKEE